MAQPLLVLQYPDRHLGRTIALASTRDWEVLITFKRAALTEARLATLSSGDDEVLRIQATAEMRRLEALLAELIPEDDPSSDLGLGSDE